MDPIPSNIQFQSQPKIMIFIGLSISSDQIGVSGRSIPTTMAISATQIEGTYHV